LPKREDIHKVLIIGSGPIVIGQAAEFDYSGTQACKALRQLGYEIVLVSFFTDISSEMLYPIIPIFLTAILHAPMSVVGLIEGIAESTASLLEVVSGWLSDKSGKRKPFVIYGYSLSTIAKPLLAFAVTWHFVLTARDALIADSTEQYS